jgi:hypothetical protein
MTSRSQNKTAKVRFSATVDILDTSTLVRLPEPARRQLSSRGQVAVRGSINGHEFSTVLESDGDKGHWMKIDPVSATANPATRQRRVEVTISKLSSGKRRPCCFDLSACTDPALAKNGKLRRQPEPTSMKVPGQRPDTSASPHQPRIRPHSHQGGTY